MRTFTSPNQSLPAWNDLEGCVFQPRLSHAYDLFKKDILILIIASPGTRQLTETKSNTETTTTTTTKSGDCSVSCQYSTCTCILRLGKSLERSRSLRLMCSGEATNRL